MVRLDTFTNASAGLVQRLRVSIRGAVQGVGFRPHVYRLATGLGLPGWVVNATTGVVIEVEGDQESLRHFLERIVSEKPAHAFIQSCESTFLDPVGYSQFQIRESDAKGKPTALVLPDIAVCPDCLSDIRDPGNRRYRYPFTNCTNCGPRFSIILSLPYDRRNTTMGSFTMCDECRREYDHPADRRFHAQPTACPRCGPHVELWDKNCAVLATHDEAIREAEKAILRGAIVAVKGLGGFHLMVDARSEEAVRRLRIRKHREEKPLAVMFPAIDMIGQVCQMSPVEKRLLTSSESPIVLLDRLPDYAGSGPGIALSVAPGNPSLGIMLPYTPLHHLLLTDLGIPVVATSGNHSDEPICIDEHEALHRLGDIADLFLVHDRPIRRHVDDSIVRIISGRELVVRRARGYAPLPVRIAGEGDAPVLAVGAHLKNTVACSNGENAFVSQHIGDLETEEAYDAFQNVTKDLCALYEITTPTMIADLHPDYISTQYARKNASVVYQVQHHYAHIASCMAENELEAPVLGVSWDGTGLGTDGTIWGGEFLSITESSFERFGTFRTFPLPGGEQAVREPRRSAIGMLFEIFGTEVMDREDLAPVRSFSPGERVTLGAMLAHAVNAPRTSSVGRIFDAVASLIGLRQKNSFEGQAAMELEYCCSGVSIPESYSYSISPSTSGVRVIEWKEILLEVMQDMKKGVEPGIIAAKFHNTLVEIIAEMARYSGQRRIVLSGGCFQNRYLLEHTIERLQHDGFLVYWHQRIPTNDGGISLGQIFAYRRMMERKNVAGKDIVSLGCENEVEQQEIRNGV